MPLTKGRTADVTVTALTSGYQCKIIYPQLHKNCFAFDSQLHRTAETRRPEACAQRGRQRAQHFSFTCAALAIFHRKCCRCHCSCCGCSFQTTPASTAPLTLAATTTTTTNLYFSFLYIFFSFFFSFFCILHVRRFAR